MLSVIIGRYCECLPVPAHACLGIFESDCLVAMAVARIAGIREVNDPVMRKVYGSPCRCIECRCVWTFVVDGRSLRQVIEILGSASEVLCGGRSISEGKLPFLVEILTFALVLS